MDLNEGTGTSIRDLQRTEADLQGRRAEQELVHNYEQLRAVFMLSETAGRAASLDEIYAAALDSLRQALGVTRASVLLFDPDHIMRFKAWLGLSDAYRHAVEGHTPWSPDERNPQPVLSGDVAADPSLAVPLPRTGEPLRAALEREGIQALGMVPLVFHSRLLGKFMVYYGAPHHFAVEEVRFMQTLASTIAFAITRKRAEDALSESEQRYRLFMQNFTGIAYQLEQGHPLPSLLEGVVADTCGYTAEAFLEGEVCWPDLIDFRDRSRILKRGQWLFNTLGATSDDEYRVVHKSGEVRWVRDIARHVVDEQTGRSFIQGAIYDMTDRKRAEEERLEMERRLLHAQKLESLGVLAGGIAHDFNNMLLAISGNLELAQLQLRHEDGSENSADRFIARAMAAIHSATGLAQQMLAYSGRGQFVVRPVNVSALVQENADLLRAAIARNRELVLHLASEVPPIHADRSQLQQVVMNLITNAAEATGDSGGRIVLTTGTQECSEEYLALSRSLEKPPPGTYVYLQVEDNGCGMNAEVQQKLFDPFFTTKFTGRGLGMAAVLGIVRSHHGAIMVQSSPNAGTSVRVLFPLVVQAVKAPNGEVETLPAPHSAPVGGPTRQANSAWPRVLVADDEPMVRSMCQALLEEWGYSPLLAGDGEEAVALFKAHVDKIACVILDLTMPRLDGLGALKAMREVQPGVHVVLSSGYSQREAMQRFGNDGVTMFIQKPYRAQSLRQILEKAAAHAD